MVQGGRLIYFNSSGTARESEPFGADTIIRVASNTKLFTSLAAYKLRDEGKLSLDDPVSKWLPDFSAHGSERGMKKSQVKKLLIDTQLHQINT